MSYFTVHKINDHVFHIYEPLDVGMTLVVGTKRAILFDTGFGVGDLAGEVASITQLPVTVMNSHGHFDHAGGNYQFGRVFADPAEFPVIAKYTADEYFLNGIAIAKERGVLPERREHLALRTAESGVQAGTGNIVPFGERTIDLGGITADIVSMPGHTPGSTGMLIREDRLLLIGDNWNPVTWVFFPECETIPVYRETMRRILELPFDALICPHMLVPRERRELEAYVRNLDGISLSKSKKVSIHPYESIDTREYRLRGRGGIVFDAAKIGQAD